MTNALEHFPERLSICMKKKGYNYASLAREIGIDKSRIYNWSKGHNLPQAYYIVKLCEVLEVSADYLLMGIER